MNRIVLPALLLGAALAVAGAAAAQTVATAQNRAGEPTTAEQIDAWLKEAPPPASSTPPAQHRAAGEPDSPWADGLGAPLPLPVIPWDAPPIVRTLADGRVHGEVGATYGTGGYGGYAIASAPVGKDAVVQVGVGEFQPTGRARRYLGGGDRRSLSLSAAWFPNRDREFDGWRRPEPPQPSN